MITKYEISEKTPIVVYGHGEDAFYVYQVCPKCGRFVKPDDGARLPEYQKQEPDATCKRCGRVKMPFGGWMADVEAEENDDE